MNDVIKDKLSTPPSLSDIFLPTLVSWQFFSLIQIMGGVWGGVDFDVTLMI